MSNPSPLFDKSDIIKGYRQALSACYIVVEFLGLNIKRQVIGMANVIFTKHFLKHRRGS